MRFKLKEAKLTKDKKWAIALNVSLNYGGDVDKNNTDYEVFTLENLLNQINKKTPFGKKFIEKVLEFDKNSYEKEFKSLNVDVLDRILRDLYEYESYTSEIIAVYPTR